MAFGTDIIAYHHRCGAGERLCRRQHRQAISGSPVKQAGRQYYRSNGTSSSNISVRRTVAISVWARGTVEDSFRCCASLLRRIILRASLMFAPSDVTARNAHFFCCCFLLCLRAHRHAAASAAAFFHAAARRALAAADHACINMCTCARRGFQRCAHARRRIIAMRSGASFHTAPAWSHSVLPLRCARAYRRICALISTRLLALFSMNAQSSRNAPRSIGHRASRRKACITVALSIGGKMAAARWRQFLSAGQRTAAASESGIMISDQCAY